MPAIAALLRRLGPFSPMTTLATFSPGARTLLRQAERSGEIALHVVRAVWWSLIMATAIQWFALPANIIASEVTVLTVAWVLGLVAFVTSRAFTFARYALIFIDAWIVLASVFVLYGPFAAAGRELFSQFGFVPSPSQLQGYVPPLLVYLALSGALRLDPRAAIFGGAIAVAGAVVYTIGLGLDRGPGLMLVPLVALSAVVAANAARVIRYVVLKATESAIYESYVPESLPRDLAHHGALERAGRVEEVTLLLCDIRGFTQLSERLAPAETVTMVNAYLDAVCPPIASAGGVIDKFMGDGVLAFFEGGGNASRALDAARRVLEAVERVELAGTRIRIGIALHSGQVLVGTVGPRTRREYTIISDAVNTVTRLEEMNKVYGSVIVASAATIAHVSEPERAGFEGPIDVAVRGRGAGIAVHVYGAATPLGDDGELGSRLRRFVGRDPD